MANERLLREVTAGRIDGVKEALSHGADVNYIDSSGNFPLKLAAEDDKLIPVAKLLIKRGADVNMVDQSRTTSLMVAAVSGCSKLVRLLLSHGANVDLKDEWQKTALMYLCTNKYQSNFVDLAGQLVKHGADVDSQDSAGVSVLMIACELDNYETVQFLLACKVKVNLQDNKGKTALMKLCMNENRANVRQLLRGGANPNLQDNEGNTALMISCRNRKSEIIKLLLQYGAELNLHNEKGRTALMKFSEFGSEENITLLLKSGATVNLRDKDGKTALMIVCELKHITSTRLIHFLFFKSDVNLQDGKGRTALMKICEKESRDAYCAQLLLNHGANVSLQDKRGKSALMIACETKNANITKLLLKTRAMVNTQDHQGKSALMFACERGTKECVEHLLQYRADVNLQDQKGISALMRACSKGTVDIPTLLLNKAATQINLRDNVGQTALTYACIFGWTVVVELLLKRGAQVNLRGNSGESALTIAAKIKSASIMALLLEHDAHFDLRDPTRLASLKFASKQECRAKVAELLVTETSIKSSTHSSPMYVLDGLEVVQVKMKTGAQLIAASELGNKNKIEFLLSAHDGADIESKDSKGRTALITASGNGHTTVTDLLLERGANIDSQDDEGYSALMTACKNKQFQSASYLLDKDADTFLKNSDGKTAFDLAVESSNVELLPLFTKLRKKPSYPGILFLEGAKRELVTIKEKNIDLQEVGITMSIPENALPPTDPPLQLEIQPCFNGSFDIPQDIELVSPAYIVKPSRKVAFQKEVLVKIWHHANLETEEDCKDMVFLSASTSPQYRGDTPVYVFKKIRGAEGSFRPGEEQPVGQIALKHFCTLALGKRRREHEDGEGAGQKHFKGNLYSARLYKAIRKEVIFCVCLCQPQYIKNCNRVMAAQYGAPDKKIQPTNGVIITSNEVSLTRMCPDGNWSTVFKKQPASISKDEIRMQEIYEISDLLEMDYPPKIEIAILKAPTSPDAGPLCLRVEGLNRDCIFVLLPGDFIEGVQQVLVDTSMIKSTVGDLKKEIQEQSKSSTPSLTLLPTASEMVTVMETIEQLLHDHDDSAGKLMVQVEEIERKSQQLKEETTHVLRHVKINYNMDVYVERANTFAVQMRTIYMANVTHCNTLEWQYAVSLFVANAANLMKAIKDTLRASKLAITLPNNYSSVTLFPQPLITLKSVQDLRLGDVAVLSQQPHTPKHALYPHSQPPITQNTTFQPPLRNTDMVCPPSPFAGSSGGIGAAHPVIGVQTIVQASQPFSYAVTSVPRTQPSISAADQSTSAVDYHPPLPHAPLSPLLTTTTSAAPSTSAQNYHQTLFSMSSYTTTTSATLSQSPPKPLTKEHMAEVCKCLFPLRAKWKTIGTFLCVDHNTLDAIKAESEDTGEMLMGLIAEWLKRCNPPPTWQALAEAVQYISPDKAKEILSHV